MWGLYFRLLAVFCRDKVLFLFVCVFNARDWTLGLMHTKYRLYQSLRLSFFILRQDLTMLFKLAFSCWPPAIIWLQLLALAPGSWDYRNMSLCPGKYKILESEGPARWFKLKLHVDSFTLSSYKRELMFVVYLLFTRQMLGIFHIIASYLILTVTPA